MFLSSDNIKDEQLAQHVRDLRRLVLQKVKKLREQNCKCCCKLRVCADLIYSISDYLQDERNTWQPGLLIQHENAKSMLGRSHRQ